MGLINDSNGLTVQNNKLQIKKQTPTAKVIALAGNPNVGKSTVFNGLTGLNQHTGNWPGKTVANAQGYCNSAQHSYVLVDIPGTYSLMAHSAEEEVARNFICFGHPDAVVIVCDATCLERNFNLVLQTLEVTSNAVVCINLLDEARRKKININLALLEKRLGVPVIGTVARQKKSLAAVLKALDSLPYDEQNNCKQSSAAAQPASVGTDNICCPNSSSGSLIVTYPREIETALSRIQPLIQEITGDERNSRWLSLKLLDNDPALLKEIENSLGPVLLQDDNLCQALQQTKAELAAQGIGREQLQDLVAAALVGTAEKICRGAITCEKKEYSAFDRRLDGILTGKATGYPIMLLMLAVIFWITITGANYPSQWLSDILFRGQDLLTALFQHFKAPAWLHGALVLGVYRVLAWVVSVMLPPMAIFFPLFTLLEDAGYLPRVAYNLDKTFKRCCACGKQALTMCLGFGCNAAGVTGCRIIDSPRERLLAILTNTFVPCNGRFPTLITILTIFFIGTAGGVFSSMLAAGMLTTVILLGILVTFAVTRLLSQTLLKGIPSSFTLELPPYRRPQIGKVIVRSILDRTVFVLGRAIIIAAPAGLIIWLLANVTVDNISLLNYCASFLEPFAQLMGLDGVILLSFILGFPANEIVLPIAIMTYMAQGSIMELSSLDALRELLLVNGWTWITAISTILFSLLHWPCSTTLLTIKKETGSWKWTALAALIPTATGIGVCILFANTARLIIILLQ